MAEIIRMPKMSDTMTEGVIASWQKKIGDVIKSGDIIAEVETDKATMDLESYQEGTLLYMGAQPGQAVPIDGILAILGNPNEDFQSLLGGSSSVSSETVISEAVSSNPAPAVVSVSAANVNATVVRMPKMSDTMTEGVLVSWLKNVGDVVKSGDMIAEVETDKATMELECYEDGTLLYIGPKAGEAIPVDGIIAVIGEAGADYQSLLTGNTAPTSSPLSVEAAPAAIAPQPTTSTSNDGRVIASPLAKALAKEKGIDLSKISGTGEGGRIVKRDLGTAATTAVSTQSPAKVDDTPKQTSTPQPVAVTGGYEDIPLTQMRKTIARRLSDSMFKAPHFYVTMEINMDNAMGLRTQINEAIATKVSFNDMVLKASALALKQHPNVNSSWLEDRIRKYNYVNIGVAVAVDEGLLVPVVRDADKKSLSSIGAEVKDYAARAKEKKLQPKDWEGNTFSISNLGMFGVDEFTAIINPPDACILAVGGIKQTAGFKADGTVFPTNVMKVTLSCDHRVVDGATAAAFLQTLKKLLENPLSMLV